MSDEVTGRVRSMTDRELVDELDAVRRCVDREQARVDAMRGEEAALLAEVRRRVKEAQSV